MKKRRSISLGGAHHLVSGAAILLGTCAVARANDLESLGRLLTPAYTAMRYAGLCVTELDWPLTQPRGPRGFAINYAQHVKDEVIAFIPEEDAVMVVKMAADAARNDARTQLRDKVIVPDKAVEAQRFREWCNG